MLCGPRGAANQEQPAMNGMGVIFDMDGVLVNSYQPHFLSWRQAAREHGLELGEKEFAVTFGRTSRDIIHALWGDRFSDAQIVAFDRRKEQAYRDIIAHNFPEMDGAGELVASLHGAGFAVAIGSSGPPENIAAVCAGLPHAELFDATVSGAEVRQGKPAPEVFLLAAKKLGLPPGRCAVIEDAPVGLEAAQRAGACAIAITGTAPYAVLATKARLVVGSLRELTPGVIGALIEKRGSSSRG
jgi:beta-phosphoglucomutase